MSLDIKQYYQQTIDKLFRAYKKKNLITILNNLTRGSALLLLVIALLILLEIIFRFSPPVKTVLFIALILTTGAAFIYFLIVPIVKSFFSFHENEIFTTANEVGEKHDSIKDTLLNSIQLLTEKDKRHSENLVYASFQSIYERSKDVDFSDTYNFQGVFKSLQYSLPILIVVIALFSFSTDFNDAAFRLYKYRQEFVIPPKITFEIKPGNTKVTKGESLRLEAKISGNDRSEIKLYTRSTDQSEFIAKEFFLNEKNEVSYELQNVLRDFTYYFDCEGEQSPSYNVEVINRPFVKGLKLVVTPPRYSGLEQTIQIDNGSVSALKGSKLLLEATTSKNVKEASIRFKDSETPLTIEGRKLSASFYINSNTTYKIHLLDEENIESNNQVEYSLNVFEDDFPSLEILSPEDELKIATDRIPITAAISDDYGFTDLTLHIKLSSSYYSKPDDDYRVFDNIVISKSELEQEIYYVWDISSLFLAEGDVVSYYLEVRDNDTVSGPKKVKSQVQTIMVPSMNEFFEEADKTQDMAQDELTKTLQEAEELNKELENLSNQLKRDDKTLTYEEKEKLENAMKKFEEMSDKATDVAEKLNEMQNDLMENNLLSPETLQKYSDLQDLMEELKNSEAMDALRKMQQELENLLRNNAQKNLDQLKANENAFKESLERTINLLKRLQVEQKIDEMIKRSEEVTEKLQELNDKLDKKENDSLNKRQDKITDEMKDFKEAMDKLKEKMQETSDMPLDQMEKIQDEFNKQNNEQLSQDTKDKLENSQTQEAQQNISQMQQNMQQMSSMFQDMQQQMNQSMQMEMFYEMARITNDLISISKEQEGLTGKTDQSRMERDKTKNLAEEQSEISNGLERVMERISGLSQKTMAITPELGKSLGSARWSMKEAQNYLQTGNSSASLKKETEAMQNVNEAAALMNNSMKQMMSGGGQGGGMMSLMQQLQQMANQQMDLNQMTQMMQQSKMAQQQLAQMERLTQDQEGIRKSLEQLNREAEASGKSKRLASNLEKILNDMKEVVRDMNTNKFDNDLIQKQEHILSRLLDAQRSINERDYDKERESNSGENLLRQSPDGLSLTPEKLDILRKELLKILKDGYKKDYEELIKRYFEAIEEDVKDVE